MISISLAFLSENDPRKWTKQISASMVRTGQGKKELFLPKKDHFHGKQPAWCDGKSHLEFPGKGKGSQ